MKKFLNVEFISQMQFPVLLQISPLLITPIGLSKYHGRNHQNGDILHLPTKSFANQPPKGTF